MARSSLFAETTVNGRPRWLKVEHLPVSRAVTYKLIKEGLISSVLLTWPGSKRGVRLIDSDSFDAYLEQLAKKEPANT
jgi:hypothetical protein